MKICMMCAKIHRENILKKRLTFKATVNSAFGHRIEMGQIKLTLLLLQLPLQGKAFSYIVISQLINFLMDNNVLLFPWRPYGLSYAKPRIAWLMTLNKCLRKAFYTTAQG